MAINYTWICNNCDVYPSKSGKSNVVHTVHWILRGTDDTNKDSDGNNLTADKVAELKLSLDTQIAEKVSPTSVQKTLE